MVRDFLPPPFTSRADPMLADLARLGLPTTVTLEEAKARWRQLALTLHPDHGGNQEAFVVAHETWKRVEQRLQRGWTKAPPPCPTCQGSGTEKLGRLTLYKRVCRTCRGKGTA